MSITHTSPGRDPPLTRKRVSVVGTRVAVAAPYDSPASMSRRYIRRPKPHPNARDLADITKREAISDTVLDRDLPDPKY